MDSETLLAIIAGGLALLLCGSYFLSEDSRDDLDSAALLIAVLGAIALPAGLLLGGPGLYVAGVAFAGAGSIVVSWLICRVTRPVWTPPSEARLVRAQPLRPSRSLGDGRGRIRRASGL
jgi:hypothetical protein